MGDESTRLTEAISDLELWRSTLESTPEIAILGATASLLTTVKDPGTAEEIRHKTSSLVYVIQRILRVSQEQVQEAQKTLAALAKQKLEAFTEPKVETSLALTEAEHALQLRFSAMARLQDLQLFIEQERDTLINTLEDVKRSLKNGFKESGDERKRSALEKQVASKTKSINSLLTQRSELESEANDLERRIDAHRLAAEGFPKKVLERTFEEPVLQKRNPGA